MSNFSATTTSVSRFSPRRLGSIFILCHITTSSFDVYFHLWNNGTPHWEREKRAWEIEHEKEWTKVLSRSAKKEAKKKGKLKHVHFAKPVVQSPPKVKHQPNISLSPLAPFPAIWIQAICLNVWFLDLRRSSGEIPVAAMISR